MPGRDGTGPLGLRFVEGRGNRLCGRGRLTFYPYDINITQKKILIEEKAYLEDRLEIINNALKMVEGGQNDNSNSHRER